MTDNHKTWLAILIIAALSALVVAAGIGLSTAVKADQSWWDRPAIRACCSDADALYADDWRVNPDGSITAMVTGGGPRNHAWAPVGRVYEIPADKVRSNEGNPIGRPLIFVNPHNNDIVLCFVPGVMI